MFVSTRFIEARKILQDDCFENRTGAVSYFESEKIGPEIHRLEMQFVLYFLIEAEEIRCESHLVGPSSTREKSSRLYRDSELCFSQYCSSRSKKSTEKTTISKVKYPLSHSFRWKKSLMKPVASKFCKLDSEPFRWKKDRCMFF